MRKNSGRMKREEAQGVPQHGPIFLEFIEKQKYWLFFWGRLVLNMRPPVVSLTTEGS